MTLANAACRWATLVLLCLCWTGCSPFGEASRDEEKDPNYLAGKNRAAALDHQGAIDAFEKALAANPRSAAAHLELGLIHHQYLATNWARAIYHFEKYIELRPKANNADLIRQRISQCKLELAKEVPFAAVNQQMQRELEKLDRLSRENTDLRLQLEQLKSQSAQRSGGAAGTVTASNPASPRHARNTGTATDPRPPCSLPIYTRASRSGSGYGTGLSNNASAIVNMATVTPMAMASMPIATSDAAGLAVRRLTA